MTLDEIKAGLLRIALGARSEDRNTYLAAREWLESNDPTFHNEPGSCYNMHTNSQGVEIAALNRLNRIIELTKEG